jgi:predicted nicotinamide N-methyase
VPGAFRPPGWAGRLARVPTNPSPPAGDPRLDVLAATVDLGDRRIAYVYPRDPAALPADDDPGGGAAYPPHWAEPWPSGNALACAVAAADWRGAAVLELGCGLGLPSVAAALAGGRVLASDRSADAVAFAAVNAECNGVAVETAVSAWDTADLLVARGPWRLVLAADVLYGHRNVTELLALLPRLVDDDGEVWVADPQRPPAVEFLAAARRTWRSVGRVRTASPGIRIHRLAGPPTR